MGVPRIGELRPNVTAYDAAWAALAESLGANLLTCDRAPARSGLINRDLEVVE